MFLLRDIIVSKVSVTILGVFLVICSVIIAWSFSQAVLDFKSMERSVIVKGLSQREVKADVMILPIEFTQTHNDLNALYQNLEQDSKKIINFLKIMGFKDEDISLQTPQIIDRLGSLYGQNEKVTYRYAGVGKVLLYTQEVDLGRKAVEDILNLGKEGIVLKIQEYDLEYIYTKLNEIKPQMIEESTSNAREAAMKFAQDSKSQLGKIKKASQGQFSITNRDKNTPYIKTIRVISTIEYYLDD